MCNMWYTVAWERRSLKCGRQMTGAEWRSQITNTCYVTHHLLVTGRELSYKICSNRGTSYKNCVNHGTFSGRTKIAKSAEQSSKYGPSSPRS